VETWKTPLDDANEHRLEAYAIWTFTENHIGKLIFRVPRVETLVFHELGTVGDNCLSESVKSMSWSTLPDLDCLARVEKASADQVKKVLRTFGTGEEKHGVRDQSRG
jgi:hypothetical protein